VELLREVQELEMQVCVLNLPTALKLLSPLLIFDQLVEVWLDKHFLSGAPQSDGDCAHKRPLEKAAGRVKGTKVMKDLVCVPISGRGAEKRSAP
jgi:hypothetical protein